MSLQREGIENSPARQRWVRSPGLRPGLFSSVPSGLFFLVLFICLTGQAFGQDRFKFDLFGGYSFLRGSHPEGDKSLHGFHVSAAAAFDRHLSIAGDLSNHRSSIDDLRILPVPIDLRLQTLSFVAGPRFYWRKEERVTPFAHGMVGVSRVSLSVDLDQARDLIGRIEGLEDITLSLSDTGLTFAAGGGVDIRATDRFAIRAVQADYMLIKISGESINNIRLSFGVVGRW